MAVCTPLLLVRGREWRRRSNWSESEGASDERPSGLTVKTPPASEGPETESGQHCQPCGHSPGSPDGFGGLCPQERARQAGLHENPALVVQACSGFRELTSSPDRVRLLLQPFDDRVGHCWCALLHHGQFVRPTRRVGPTSNRALLFASGGTSLRSASAVVQMPWSCA